MKTISVLAKPLTESTSLEVINGFKQQEEKIRRLELAERAALSTAEYARGALCMARQELGRMLARKNSNSIGRK